MLVLVMALLFALLFGHALVSFLRGRDALAGEVSLLFGAFTGIFVGSVARLLMGGDEPPRVVSVISTTLILLVPLITLRLVSRFRSLPRWLMPTVAALLVVSITLMVLFGEDEGLPGWALWVALGSFVAGELIAAYYFFREGRERAGAARLRLYIAGLATALVGVALLTSQSRWDNSTEVGALLAAIGYVGAFMPPRPVRSMSAMAAAHMYGRRLLSGPSQPTAQEVWRRFATAVHDLTECDAVVVLSRTSNGQTTTEAASGIQLDHQPVKEPVDFDLVNGLVRQRRVNADCPIESRLARLVNARFSTLVPLRPPYDGLTEHVAMLFSQHRSLFSDDDLEVIRDLGAQATLLAGRAESAYEQRRLANELGEMVDALHVASKAKSDLLARVSHEFRTPLTAIIGYSALLRRSMESGDPMLAQTGPERIHSAGLHLLALVEEVLDLAHMDAGHLHLEVEDVHLSDMVERTIDELRPLATRKRLTLRADVPDGTLPVDPNRMRQVLYNLLSNAIKFTPAGGTVSVLAEMDEDKVRVSVVDDGIGIPLEDQPRIFEEFTQVAEHGPHEGSGLGLAIVRRLVAAHGGHTELESSPGEGSRFIVNLPRRAEARQALGLSPAEPGRGVGGQ
ncbi:MAG TPA: HAMP domain-containing sensor histidine kinase [Nocardioidaceae bacterium]|nr:HAMP domain-containing sensor histidine kinase [Nocardioidaceae bacterium]